jgi:hypothetical protein
VSSAAITGNISNSSGAKDLAKRKIIQIKGDASLNINEIACVRPSELCFEAPLDSI